MPPAPKALEMSDKLIDAQLPTPIATIGDLRISPNSDYLYCFGKDRGDTEEIRPILLQFGEFVEPLRGFLFGHALPVYDETSDDLCNPIAKWCIR